MALPSHGDGRFGTTTGWSVVWTRGDGCAELAELLAAGEPRQADSDLRAACLRARADLLVARKLTSFDLVSVAVPVDFEPEGIGSVVAAVGGGPHSVLAARVAERLASVVGVEGSLVTAAEGNGEKDAAERILAGLSIIAPELEVRVAQVDSARALVGQLPPDALLVVGASGGSWLQRQFFGPGRQLVVGAPGGAVVVRSAPERCFQRMSEPTPISINMLVGDVLRFVEDRVAPVVDDGRLVGIVRRRDLAGADPKSRVAPFVEDPMFVHDDDPVDAVAEVTDFLDHGPVPVVDADGRLVGVV